LKERQKATRERGKKKERDRKRGKKRTGRKGQMRCFIAAWWRTRERNPSQHSYIFTQGAAQTKGRGSKARRERKRYYEVFKK